MAVPRVAHRLGSIIMRCLRTVLIVIASALAVPAIVVTARAQAGQSEALQVANELFGLLSKDMLADLTSSMTAQMWPMVERQMRPGLDQQTLAELRSEFERIQKASLAEVMQGAAPIYARHFTAGELRDLINFYNSPTGQKALKELPQVMSEILNGMMPRMQQLQIQANESLAKILRERGYLK
jgi:hypothetical protein